MSGALQAKSLSWFSVRIVPNAFQCNWCLPMGLVCFMFTIAHSHCLGIKVVLIHKFQMLTHSDWLVPQAYKRVTTSSISCHSIVTTWGLRRLPAHKNKSTHPSTPNSPQKMQGLRWKPSCFSITDSTNTAVHNTSLDIHSWLHEHCPRFNATQINATCFFFRSAWIYSCPTSSPRSSINSPAIVQ